MAVSKLARDMLPVFDNLKRALDAAGDETREVAKGLIEGVELTMKELISVLGKHGVQNRSCPRSAIALTRNCIRRCSKPPVPGTKAGDIIQVMTEGFMLHERLLRPAQVGVSSTPKT